jgi:hypothetical protein
MTLSVTIPARVLAYFKAMGWNRACVGFDEQGVARCYRAWNDSDKDNSQEFPIDFMPSNVADEDDGN